MLTVRASDVEGLIGAQTDRRIESDDTFVVAAHDQRTFGVFSGDLLVGNLGDGRPAADVADYAVDFCDGAMMRATGTLMTVRGSAPAGRGRWTQEGRE